ncbi:MAG: tetratricopeptide repeat protein [Pseudomonadota bacterium]
MSNNDSFIEEVSEEVRRDRMFALWKRYGPFVIGAIVLIVAAAGGKAWLDFQAREDAKVAGGAVIAAASAPPGEAAAALTAIADQADHEGAALLARLRAAAALAADGDAAGAAAAYDVVASSPSADGLMKDFAAFRALALRADDMAPADALAALEPMANGSGPFRLLALEAQAAAHLRAGDRDAAIAALQTVGEDETAPNGLRQRALAALSALGAPATTGAELVGGQG